MELRQADIARFNLGKDVEDPRFWIRIGVKPDFRERTVLEVGCGLGSMCINIASEGAKKVVGVDINPKGIEFANTYLERNYPQLINKVEFKTVHLADCEEISFDYIISKDAFEHIIDMDDMLNEMKKRLKPGGQIYTGFGPLYPSPYGDHGRRQFILRPFGWRGKLLILIPWGHLFMENTLIKMYKVYKDETIESMRDLGLSTMSVSDYRKAFDRADLNIINWRINQSEQIISKIFYLVSRIPFLEDYFTHSIYCILEKKQMTKLGP